MIVIAVAASTALVIWEWAQRLFDPRLIEQVPAVVSAGAIGVIGNELVASVINAPDPIDSPTRIREGTAATRGQTPSPLWW